MSHKTNRAEKIALLTKIVQGEISEEDIQKLRRSNGPGAVLIIHKAGEPYPGEDDEVSFHHNGQDVTMPYRDIQAFTRFDPLTIIRFPDNGRMGDLR